MKGVLEFLKKRWLPIVCVVVVLATLPTAWIFSQKWNDKLLEEAQADAGDKLNKIKRAKVTYVVPSVVPGQADTTIAAPPNPQLTAWAAEQRKMRVEQVKRVIDDATQRNKGAHKPMVQGLYPNPPENDSELKRRMREYLEFMLGDSRRNEPSWYARTLRQAGAGTPPNAAELAQVLAEQKEREEAIAAAESDNGQVPQERQEAINENLVNRRIGEYRRHAQNFSFYADETVLGGHQFFPPPSMEARAGATVPSPTEGYMWMADGWLLEDILAAIRRANTGAGGEQTEVELSPVKRILKLEIDQLPLFAQSNNDRGEDDFGSSSGSLAAREGRVPIDPAVSVTGRVSSPQNQVYDVRRARVELVVSSEKLPQVIEAFHSTGLMTVTDLDLEEVDVWEHLRQGYAYGSEHVMKATMDIEVVWLRSWTVPLMPESVRRALGVQNNG